MKIIKVPVRDEFYEEIREEAHSRRISMAEVVREYLASNHAVASMKPPNPPLPQPSKPNQPKTMFEFRAGCLEVTKQTPS